MKIKIKPKESGQKPIEFTKGGLHQTTHTPQSEKIPTTKFAAALAGKYGAKGKSQELFAKNILHHK